MPNEVPTFGTKQLLVCRLEQAIMFVITNRELLPNGKGLKKLGDRPSSQGPNELRVVEAVRSGGSWKVQVLEDVVSDAKKREAGIKDASPVYASRYVAKKVLTSLQANKRNFLFFVHGYNNNVEEVLDRAHRFSRQYNVEVMPFSWPANGGGARGVASYLSDKQDAQASVPALGRCLEKMCEYLGEFSEQRAESFRKKAEELYPANAERREQYITRKIERGCPFTVNLVAHSMGNYLFKHVLQSSVYQGGRKLLFDNVSLVAADTNNEGHARWVDRITCRKRIYVTINEDDSALMASRMKLGDLQKARLGHYPFNLYSEKAIYVNLTGARNVGRSHAYFEGKPVSNVAVKRFFTKAFNGDRAEDDLKFDPAKRYHLI